MTSYVLANSIYFGGAMLHAGRIVDDRYLDVPALVLAGALLEPLSAGAILRGEFLTMQRVLRGSSVPYDAAKFLDQVGPFTGPSQVGTPYIIDPAVQVNDFVYVPSTDRLDRAQANSALKVPAIGAVVIIPTSGTGILQSVGEVSGFSGLVAGRPYYLSPTVPGGVTATAPSALGQFVQKVGYAKDPTTLVLEVDLDYVAL